MAQGVARARSKLGQGLIKENAALAIEFFKEEVSKGQSDDPASIFFQTGETGSLEPVSLSHKSLVGKRVIVYATASTVRFRPDDLHACSRVRGCKITLSSCSGYSRVLCEFSGDERDDPC